MSWSRVVTGPREASEVLARTSDDLDLRAAGAVDDGWAALGAVEVVPGELTVPVPQELRDLDATRALGARLAEHLRPGDLVVLSGPLGAGKTSLTQGIGAALGVRGAVTSPTFVLARAHRGPVPLLHVDAYRLREAGARFDLDDLDLEASLEDAVTVVEWGEGLAASLTDSWVEVHLERPTGEAETGSPAGRTARVVCRGPRWPVLPQR